MDVDALLAAAESLPVVFVAHPRTIKGLEKFGRDLLPVAEMRATRALARSDSLLAAIIRVLLVSLRRRFSTAAWPVLK